MRFTQIIATHLFLVKDKKILLSRRFNTGYEDGNFSLPAGHVEKDETTLEALIRETKEEIDILLDQKELKFSHVMHRRTDDHRVDFFFLCNNWSGKIKNNETNKCDLLEWYPINKLPQNMVPYVRQAIEMMDKNIYYSELGF